MEESPTKTICPRLSKTESNTVALEKLICVPGELMPEGEETCGGTAATEFGATLDVLDGTQLATGTVPRGLDRE